MYRVEDMRSIMLRNYYHGFSVTARLWGDELANKRMGVVK